jgi:hypothetical protein
MAIEQYATCIEACNACADACDSCSTACLQEQNMPALARCIALDMDCAEICRLASAYMARNSMFAAQLCKQCEEVCEACGEECAKHQMAHCQRCAEACRRCADECRRIAQAAGATRASSAQATRQAQH